MVLDEPMSVWAHIRTCVSVCMLILNQYVNFIVILNFKGLKISPILFSALARIHLPFHHSFSY